MTISVIKAYLEEQDPIDQQQIIRPTQIAGQWAEAIPPGGVDDADNGAGVDINNPETQLAATASARQPFTVAKGTTLLVRMKYVAGITTDPILQAFGRYDSNERFQRLRTRSGNIDMTMITAESGPAVDLTDGTNFYTTVDLDDHALDLEGCRDIIIGVKTAAAGGTPASATIEIKVI